MTAVDPSPDRDLASTGDRYTSHAEVTTGSPGRYAKQLVSHLGRRIPFTQNGNSWSVTIDGVVGRITIGDGLLLLDADAPDPEGLGRVEHALGSHLERFGRRNELTVSWRRTANPA